MNNVYLYDNDDKNLILWKADWLNYLGTSGDTYRFDDSIAGSTINSRITDTDPFGSNNVIWKAEALTGTGNTGGWTTRSTLSGRYITIDSSKKYRYSVWINRKIASLSSFYFGPRSYTGPTTIVLTGMTVISTGVYSTNPYFMSFNSTQTTTYLPENNWRLLVAHVFPYTRTGTTNDAESGIYDINGNLTGITLFGSDYKWHQNSYYGVSRILSPYLSASGTTFSYYPRIDLVDGTEPTINELLGKMKVLYTDDGYIILKL